MSYAVWRYLLWPSLAGVTFLVIALLSVRRELSFKPEALPLLGRVFVPASLAVFGAEHLVGARFIMQMVPSWIPAHLFWAYFVGFALFAAAISIVLMKYVRLSATLLGLMFILFVLMIHLPNVAAHPRDRFAWAVALRDLVFALGAWALAGSLMEQRGLKVSHRLIAACRSGTAVVLLFYAFEHFLHPQFTPGVPLEQLTPKWIPIAPVWGLFMGAMLLVCGVSILINKNARMAATWLGMAAALMVVIIYVPMLVATAKPSEVNTAVNYIADTLLFAGSILFVAGALPVSPKDTRFSRQTA